MTDKSLIEVAFLLKHLAGLDARKKSAARVHFDTTNC